ncbi:MAG: hypothetical protein JXA42_22835 [Anaerolineales bacterium]|nr:hypothetical protein [Anaerolineales bacterium]
MLEQLIHNGVLIAPKIQRYNLSLTIREKPLILTAKQEEMAIAWARKQGTPYVEDKVFVENFMADFSKELGITPPLDVSEVDFSPAIRIVEAERAYKASMSREDRKAAAAARKELREELKEKYGYAIVNGDRVELGNYMTEPSGIFMGRGKHPLRGRWKEGAGKLDVTLNLSPDAPRPDGNWEEIVWQPESIWVARWKDKLSEKMKYVWISDTAPIKQEREAEKFDKAITLGENLDTVRARIERDLENPDEKYRMVATACHLIDVLCLRVGDEKDEDEADTVGATTLRPEHVTLLDGGLVEFRFLGKDSVLWHKKIELSNIVRKNLSDLIENARPSSSNKDVSHPTRDLPQLFPDISSRDVNNYLSEIIPELSAKVFRTYHATQVVKSSLDSSNVKPDDPEFAKKEAATLANMEAAILCNHTKKGPANWSARKEKMKERQENAMARVDNYRDQLSEYREKLAELNLEAKEKIENAGDKNRSQVRKRYKKRKVVAQRNIDTARDRLERARLALEKVKSRNKLVSKGRTWNLGTSLKSYIDPRVYCRWGNKVEYDVLEKFYPKALQKKFIWAANQNDNSENKDADSD